MDVHPPLAKLMITLFGYLAGFDGEFDFKDIGKDYLEPGVPYVAMRLYPALCGIFLAPTMFLTLKAAGCRTFTAALGAGMIIFGTHARSLLNAFLLVRVAYLALIPLTAPLILPIADIYCYHAQRTDFLPRPDSSCSTPP